MPVSSSLGELAVRFGCELRGDPDVRVTRVATLAGGADALGFVASPAWRDELRQTQLAAVVLDSRLAVDCPTAALVHRNPHATFARIAALLHPPPPVAPGRHPTALVDASARIDASAEVGAFAVIGAGVQVGPRCVVGPYCMLADGVSLAADVRLVARVTLGERVSLGERCLVHPGAVIGADGFGNARDGEHWVKVPQLGTVQVGADVEIGANTTIDRGALDDTVIGEGVRLDNQIQVGHNVVIGAHTAIAACTGIAGSAKIGSRCMIGGGTGIGQVEIADDVVITGFGMVSATLHNPGVYSSVLPVEEARTWRRIVGRLKRLDELNLRVRKLEQDHDD